VVGTKLTLRPDREKKQRKVRGSVASFEEKKERSNLKKKGT